MYLSHCMDTKVLIPYPLISCKRKLLQDIPMLLEWKSCELIEMNIQKGHIHLIFSMPPKMSLSQLMGILKGKTAIKIFKSYPQIKTKPY